MTFIRTSRWLPTTGGKNGSSWVELLVRFMHLGGQGVNQIEDDPRARKPFLAKLLPNFTDTLKQVTFTCLAPGDRCLSAPTRSEELRLKLYGITDHLLCIFAQLCVNSADAADMRTRTTQLVTTAPKKKQKALEQGELTIHKNKLLLKPTPQGQEPEKPTTLVKLRSTAKETAEANSTEAENGLNSLFSLSLWCHTCMHKRHMQIFAFMQAVTCKPNYCSKCNLASRSSKWFCDCGEPWHTYAAHRVIGQRLQRALLQKRQQKQQVKALAKAAVLGQLGQPSPTQSIYPSDATILPTSAQPARSHA